MKITKKENTDFKPVTIEITFENKEELDFTKQCLEDGFNNLTTNVTFHSLAVKGLQILLNNL